MSERDDPFAELGAAWRSMPTPEPTRDLAGEDERTRAAVAWMAAAWRALEAPQAEPRSAPVPRRPRLVRRALPWVGLAAAAAAALVLALVDGGAPADAPREREPVAHRDPEPLEAQPKAPAVRVASVENDRVEMSAGNVRLIFFPSGPTGPRFETNEDER